MRLAVKIAIGVVLIVLGDSGFTLAFVSPSGSVAMEGAVVLGWLLLIAWTARRGWLAWRLLLRRPHPFLANSPQ
jgi:hypothetical protein